MTAALAQAFAANAELNQLDRINADYIDSEERVLENPPVDFVAEESVMSITNIESILL